ncbi:MAG: cyclic nucleotide-binding domain-containing protein [Candidatus Binatia bacterium]
METGELRKAAIFGDLRDAEAERLLAVARPRQCHKGECLFLLGDHADRLYVVLSGKVELTFPLSFGGAVRDVPVESKTPGSSLGWSALVKPHRFTLSARAAETSELAAFLRQDLLRVFESEPRIGYVVMQHVAEVIGRRLLQVQALWARELQRAVTNSLTAATELKR